MALFLTAFTLCPALLQAEGPDRARAESIEKEASALAREGELDKAVEAVRLSIKTDPSASAYVLLGKLLIKIGYLDEASVAFDEALRIAPGLHNALTGRGMVLSRKGDLKKAEAVLRDALALNPDPVRTYYELGVVYTKMGDTASALSEYKEGIKKFKQGRK